MDYGGMGVRISGSLEMPVDFVVVDVDVDVDDIMMALRMGWVGLR